MADTMDTKESKRTWEDLTDDERYFLELCRRANPETVRDVFAFLINHRRNDDNGAGCEIIEFPKGDKNLLD